MTVHDMEDGDSFVASGIAVCVPGKAVTVTGVRPHAGSSGLQVIGFATFIEPVKAESDVPISLRGSLSEVKAPTSSGRVTTACASSKDAQATEHTFIGWEVTSREPGPGSSESFTVVYKDERGRSGTVDIPVAITVCAPTETTGKCAN